MTQTTSTPVRLRARDGFVLAARHFAPTTTTPPASPAGTVVIASATGVKATYYRRYAEFLAGHGFHAVTFDYRGVGESREPFAVARRARWADWGALDADAVLGWARTHLPGPLLTVGHSYGGFGIGLADEARHVARHVAVGGQHAHWRDYRARPGRARMWARWHAAMPAITLARGHFPGRRLGWLEDLPRGVALDWARSRRDFTASARTTAGRDELRRRLAAFTADALIVAPVDDDFGTDAALDRADAYSPGRRTVRWRVRPEELGVAEIGHFGLFHARFAPTFWPATLEWLRDGVAPAAAR